MQADPGPASTSSDTAVAVALAAAIATDPIVTRRVAGRVLANATTIANGEETPEEVVEPVVVEEPEPIVEEEPVVPAGPPNLFVHVPAADRGKAGILIPR